MSWIKSEAVVDSRHPSKLFGSWWESCPTEPDMVSGGDYTFGHSGKDREPDWTHADISMDHWTDHDGPVEWIAERFTLDADGVVVREVRRRVYRWVDEPEPMEPVDRPDAGRVVAVLETAEPFMVSRFSGGWLVLGDS